MYPTFLVLAVTAGIASARSGSGTAGSDCLKLSTMTKTLNDLYCDQPLFINFIQKNELTQMLDHVCVTFFPLPDDPNTFNVFLSRTYCDGSNEVISFVGTDLEQGVIRLAKPDVTYTYTIFGYAGCNTDLIYRCRQFGMSDAEDPYVFGLSAECRAIGLSCLRKVEEIVSDNCIPESEFYVLPNKLPNRCVTTRQCFIPNANNQFYKSIGFSGPVSHLV
uniref:Uncharacterized protein n=1 Tax=Graphocephala atropunctata TaxID=36148 RepID=A0A1B6LJZ0_9HEMI